jgi:expansin (peptidoglycan-binding protein)
MLRLSRALAALACALLACGSDSSSDGSSGASGSSGAASSSSSSSGGSSSGGDPAAIRSLGAPEAGEATYYAADGSGNCSFDKSPDDLMVAAMNATEYASAALCGACMRVTGKKGEAIVRIVDKCPGCRANGGIDLSKEAFAKVDDVSRGRVPVTLELVSCPVKGSVDYRFKEGSSKYWTAIQLRNHKLPLKSLEYKKGGAWQPMPRADYNYFIASSGVGDQPGGLALRATSADGHVIEDTVPTVLDGQTAPGAAQFQ